ncbi:MAG: ABC transporter permease [Ignavibacteriales bacterium]|nr:ABC transporter permease [Ignavibacteriales bacterium]
MFTKILAVARWEFLEKVKTKAFIVSLLMMPLIMGIFTAIPGLLMSKGDAKTRQYAIIDQTKELASKISNELDRQYKLPGGIPNYRLDQLTDGDMSLEHLKALATSKMLAGEIEGCFIIPANVADSGSVEFRAQNVGNIRDQERFTRIVESSIVENRLLKSGFDPQQIKKLTTKIDIKTIKISAKGEEKESGFLETYFSGYIFIMMLMFLVLTSGQMLIRSMVEEKSNRIVEILLSSCSPRELMSGKVLGLSLLGLTTVLFWIAILVAVVLGTKTHYLEFEHVLLLLLYFVLGYLLYAALFVAVGAPLTTEQDAQQATSLVSIALVVPLAFALPVMQDPNSLLSRILTQIPFFTPTFMALRLSIQLPEWWEIALSLTTLSLSIAGMMWVASRIFRIGILLTGKKPSLKELLRWVTTNT